MYPRIPIIICCHVEILLQYCIACMGEIWLDQNTANRLQSDWASRKYKSKTCVNAKVLRKEIFYKLLTNTYCIALNI